MQLYTEAKRNYSKKILKARWKHDNLMSERAGPHVADYT